MKSSSSSAQIFEKKLVAPSARKALPQFSDEIPFGRVQTDHMLVCDFLPSLGGWQVPQIVPYGPFSLSPDAVVFHYGQQIFEGMKVCRDDSFPQKLHFFRPELNAKRFFNSAVRLGMEPVPEHLFLSCIKELVAVEHNWALKSPGSLYVRPALIPLDCGVSYRASESYRFFVIVSPAKDYYANPEGVSVTIERTDVRASIGGVGEAKCGGNYAAALQALKRAQNDKSEQVLWLDSVERKYVEEVGAMNIFFVYEDRIETPELSGSILPGITRKSLIELIPKETSLPVVCKKIDIDGVLASLEKGTLKEVFGCGTAAVVSCVSEFKNLGKSYPVAGKKPGKISLFIKQKLTEIQNGKSPDLFGWRDTIQIKED